METLVDRGLEKLARANMRLRFYTPKITEFCFIIGAMKSGTTTLYSYLVQHPEIAKNRFQKEPEYFSKESAPDGISSYCRQWLPNPFRRQIALEASTGYTKHPSFPNVAARLRVVTGKKYFIYILRDPIDRIESHLAHNNRNGSSLEYDQGFEKALEHCISVSRYAAQLDHYREAFPNVQVKIVLMKGFVKAPEKVLREVCEYLSIDPDYDFEALPAQNTRPPSQSCSILTEEHREYIYHALAEDTKRLHDQYGVDVFSWRSLDV